MPRAARVRVSRNRKAANTCSSCVQVLKSKAPQSPHKSPRCQLRAGSCYPCRYKTLLITSRVKTGSRFLVLRFLITPVHMPARSHSGSDGPASCRTESSNSTLEQSVILKFCDGRPLCAFRAAFGALMLIHSWRLHVHEMYARSVLHPRFRFHYTMFGIELIPWLPSTTFGAHCHLLLLCISSLGIALGVGTRCCAAVFAVAHLAFVLSDRTIFNNHYYLYELLAVLIACTGCDGAYALVGAVKAALSTSAEAASAEKARFLPTPTWQRLLFRLQVVLVYAYAGVAKLNSDWLLHAQVQHFVCSHASHLPAGGPPAH